MADKKAAAALTVIEGGNKKTAEQIAHEQTAERFALNAWAKVVAMRILTEMSNLAAETLARTQVDDQNDEETDEDFLNEQRDIENELVEKEIDVGLEAYPDVAALQTALDQSLRTYLEQETALEKNEIAKLLDEIKTLLASALEAAKKAGRAEDFPAFTFADRYTPAALARVVRKALKQLFEDDPVFSKHVRDDVPGRNLTSWGQNCRTSSYGTYAKVDDFVKQGGLAALFSGGWKRIAKDRIEPWAWSYEVAPERKNPQANWRHRFHITERTGERSILEIPREYLVGNGARAIKLLMKAGVHVINRRPETLALARHLHWKPKREIVRMPRATWHQIGRHWIFVTADETIIPPDIRR